MTSPMTSPPSARTSTSAGSSRSNPALASSGAWRTRAFGLDLEVDFPMPGLEPGAWAGDGRQASVRRTTEDDLRGGWDESAAERLSELRYPDGRLAVTIDHGGGQGFLIRASQFGLARVGADGRSADVAPEDLPDWRWQRYLTGQVFPFLAVLQGLEVFHASAVVIDGAAVAVVAHSGSGKTSLGLNLALDGLPFLADDVLVVEPRDDTVVIHPGIGLANVRRQAAELAERVEQAGLGWRIGESEEEIRMAIRRHDEPVPLKALFYLRRLREGEGAEVELMQPVEPRLLLAGTFNFVVRTPERLARQLDVCARIAQSAQVFRVASPPAVDAVALAREIRVRAEELGHA
jgi:hypothetical protein